MDSLTKNFSFSKASFEKKLSDAEAMYKKYIAAPLCTDLADELAQKLWQCTDYAHREKLCNCNFEKVRDCQRDIRDACKALAAINDICDSDKHAGIDRAKVNLREVSQKQGSFSRAFCFKSFDTPALLVEYNDGTSIDFQVVASEAMKFLKNNYLTKR
ncbi:hypothetical protein CGG83_24310 [Vibrio parahaemolyticus]|nr:hypothetical protein CGG83_24310 [Vibrio parahaemolyticus]TOR33347.1 hypothetical protein CGG76_24155 [Vibrio parahaemolyticus]